MTPKFMDRHGLRPRDDEDLLRPRDDEGVLRPRDDEGVLRLCDEPAVIASAARQSMPQIHGSPRPAASR